MFNVGQEEVRRYFAHVWQNRQSALLDPLQKKALAIILEHPEYHYVLEDVESYLDKYWHIELGETNPFLHLSLHMSLQEQCAIDQPEGIATIAQTLTQKYDDRHQAEHVMMDALSEMIWQAQRSGGFDVNLYITLLRKKIGQSAEETIRLNPHEIK